MSASTQILRPPAYTLMNLLPFVALGWLLLGLVAAAVLRARRPARVTAADQVTTPAEP